MIRLFLLMSLQSYYFRLKTASETIAQQKKISNSDNLCLYFKGEHGLTQTLIISLNKLNKDVYECRLELIDVGILTLLHVKLQTKIIRWKLNWIEVERIDKNEQGIISKFPIDRWLDSNQQLDILVDEGPTQLASVYTITICTGTISRCSQVNIQVALIGDGSSTLPFDLDFNSAFIPENLFHPGAKDMFRISPLQSVDVGQLFHVQLWCDSIDKLPYYCESIEVINNTNNENYFFPVNHWFGLDLEQRIYIPVINRAEEPTLFTISIKTKDISYSNGENIVIVHMKFKNGKSHEEILSASETHKIPFEKDNIDFFLVAVDNLGDSEIVHVKVCLVNKRNETTRQVQWNCAWIELRDIFYQRNYCYTIPNTLVSNADNESYNYTALEKLTDLPCLTNFDNSNKVIH